MTQTKDCSEWGYSFGLKNKFLGNSEWGHSLKIKTKGYKRKKVWWVRTSIEKKRLLQTKDCGEWGHRFGIKKSMGNDEWGHSLKKKTKDYQRNKIWWVRTSIERKKKDCNKQKIVVSEDIFLGWKKF